MTTKQAVKPKVAQKTGNNGGRTAILGEPRAQVGEAKKLATPRVRPLFTPEVVESICKQLSDGKHLKEICAVDGMPADSTVRLWVLDDVEGFAALYARAREVGYERLADEILQIADDGSNDTYQTDDGEATNHDVIARSKLRVDSRKWMLAKMLPKKYGDKVTQEHIGENGGPVTHSIKVLFGAA